MKKKHTAKRRQRTRRVGGGPYFDRFKNFFRWPQWLTTKRKKHTDSEDVHPGTEHYREHPPHVLKAELLPIDFDFKPTSFKENDADHESPNSVALSTEFIKCDILKKALTKNQAYLDWVLEYHAPNIPANHTITDGVNRVKQNARQEAMKRTYLQTQQRKKILELKLQQCNRIEGVLRDQKLLREFNNLGSYYEEPQ